MIQRVIDTLKQYRRAPLKRSMFLSMACKLVGMIISFFYTPILLAYLDEEAYGIWATILSVINWINYFDVGIGQGLRNVLTKAIALDDREKAQESVSTGYVALSAIAGCTFLVGVILIIFLDISAIFNTKLSVKPVLLVSFFCICINFIVCLSKTLLYATQQAEKVGFMTVLTQGVNFVGILALSLFGKGNLLAVAVIIGFSSMIVNLIFTGKVWNRFGYLIPNFKNYRSRELKGICNVGMKFFFVQIAALILYSTDNMIITRLFGPAEVTPYHTSYALFGIVNGLFGAMISPLWSKYTVAMETNDYQWIKKTVYSLDKMLLPVGVILIIGTIVFEPVSRVWLHKNLIYTKGLIPCMALYYILSVWGSIYANVLNGMGMIDMQLVLGCVTAAANIPLSIFFGKKCGMGSAGVCLATVVCMLMTNILITINTHKLLKQLETINCWKHCENREECRTIGGSAV